MNEEEKESLYRLQRIDCNCNDCFFMARDFEEHKKHNALHNNTNASYRIQYGHCQKLDKPVSFIPNTCQIETQKCFVHRKDVA